MKLQLYAKRLAALFRVKHGDEGRLVRHYFFALTILISGGTLTSGIVELYFSYRQIWELHAAIQKETANSIAYKIERFLREIENHMKAATKSRELVRDGLTSEYKWELRRLLVNVEAITEVSAFKLDGDLQANASRLRSPTNSDQWKRTISETSVDLAHTFFGDVYFARGAGHYMTLAVPIEPVAGNHIGVLFAEVDLKYIGQLLAQLRVGRAGHSYLVDRSGQLIAHPELSLVLQRRDLSRLAPVSTALGSEHSVPLEKLSAHQNIEGPTVFTSHAIIPGPGWVVLVEQPVREIYPALFGSLLRTALLLLTGLLLAILATALIRNRIVRPLETLRHGVARIRQGDLSAQLELPTGDEFEILADDFNSMSVELRRAYSELEQKVAERTEELTTANAQLAQASEQKSRFLANANHELRTPLSSIIGYARLIKRETEGQITTLQQENLDDLMRNAERLMRLIDTLLDFAKIEAGKIDIKVDPVRIDELIVSVTATVEPMLNKDNVRLVCDLPDSIAPFYTDSEKLRQIMLNLLSNAIKFTERGEIRISARQVDADIRLAVDDTGVGIDQADINHIFDEFDRGSSANNGRYPGTGLGLAIVKRLVDLLGGSVAVESELGKGSTFTVTLPVHRGQP